MEKIKITDTTSRGVESTISSLMTLRYSNNYFLCQLNINILKFIQADTDFSPTVKDKKEN